MSQKSLNDKERGGNCLLVPEPTGLTVVDTIRKRKLQLFGYICRMSDDRLLKTLLFGVVEGERRPGIPARR